MDEKMKHVRAVREWLKGEGEKAPVEPEEAMALVIGEDWLRYLSTIAKNIDVPLEELVAASILLFPRTATSADPDSLIDDVLFASKGAGAFMAMLKKMRELGKIVPCRAKFYAGADELSDILIQVEFDKTGVDVRMMRSNGLVIRRSRISYPTFQEIGLEMPSTMERDDSILDVEHEYGDLVSVELL